MSSITAQQTKLDLELVPKENRIDIGKCRWKKPSWIDTREPHFKSFRMHPLTPSIQHFSTLQLVPEGQHQFWDSVYKLDTISDQIDKEERFKLTLEVFRDIVTPPNWVAAE
ncbi:hypothetical protein Tco_0217481 [Tanacetum coccineum]